MNEELLLAKAELVKLIEEWSQIHEDTLRNSFDDVFLSQKFAGIASDNIFSILALMGFSQTEKIKWEQETGTLI